MEATLSTEYDLQSEAAKYGLLLSTSETNERLLTHLLKRQLTNTKTRTPNPFVDKRPIENKHGYPEIIWESMSCYVDALMNILLLPQLEDLLWETITYLKHPVPMLCRDEIEKVRDTWRDTVFALLQKQRVSLRPFLTTLKECEDYISPDTPFWTTCLNDPMEFIQNAFIPLLSVDSSKMIQELFREQAEYKVIEGHRKVDPIHTGDSEATKSYRLQVISLNQSEIDGGTWLAKPETFFTVATEFPSDPPVFITKDTWEFNGNRKVFIQNKTREVPLSERTDEIGSQVTHKTTIITPFHPKADVLMMGIQSDISGQRLREIPLVLTKGSTTWDLVGVILFSMRHYTALMYDTKRETWLFYDSLKTSPEDITESDAKRQMLQKGRSFVYRRRHSSS